MHPYFLLVPIYLFVFPLIAIGDEFSLGAVIDFTSHTGKEEKVAMNMAIEECYKYTGHKPVLHVRDSSQVTTGAAFAALKLINEEKVGAILGLRTWDELAFIAENGNRAQVPILSFSDTIPVWASTRWPYLVEAKHNNYKQMDVVAAIVGTWRWRKVSFIYEDVDSMTFSTIPYLIDALGEVGSSVDTILPLPPLASLFEQLEKLKRKQCRVFIVHTSLSLAKHLFVEAKKLELMGKDSVWITTTSITDHLDFVNASVISSMQGVLGVKTNYFQSETPYKDFSSRFRSRFQLDHPEEVNFEPGIFALQAYDAVTAVAIAIGNVSVVHGQELLEKLLLSNFKGLTGEFRFVDGVLTPSNLFQIANVVGKGYRGLGFWSEGLGFSRSVMNEISYNMSMTILGQVIWPGNPLFVPRGWALPTSESALLIGVPESATYTQFTNVRYDVGGKPSFGGYSIDVFKAVLRYLPYHLPYEFIPYNGSYDSLVKQIYFKKFDAVVGDTSIVANRCDFAEFSHPWTDSGLQMVVFKKSLKSNRAWLFVKPFTGTMWGLTACLNIYNGFVVWLMENPHNPNFKGSFWNKVGAMVWLAFTTLFSLHGDRPHGNLARVTMVVWLFVAVIIVQSYTASLSSMLTIPRIEPAKITVEYLKQSNAKVGCDGGSFVIKYLEDVLGLHPRNIRTFFMYTDYHQALEQGEIAAAFVEVPYIKILMAKHCNDFTVVGPVHKVGGFGFVFPKGSPILPDISKAVLELSEDGTLLEMENAFVYSYNCSDSKSSDEDSLDVPSFVGLFFITGGTTTICLVLYLIRWRMGIEGILPQDNAKVADTNPEISSVVAHLKKAVLDMEALVNNEASLARSLEQLRLDHVILQSRESTLLRKVKDLEAKVSKKKAEAVLNNV